MAPFLLPKRNPLRTRGLVKSSEQPTAVSMIQLQVQTSWPKGLTCPNIKDYHEADANNLQKELPRIPRAAMFENFKAFKKAGLVLVDLHINYEQMQAYAGCTVSGLETDADDFLVTSSKELKGAQRSSKGIEGIEGIEEPEKI